MPTARRRYRDSYGDPVSANVVVAMTFMGIQFQPTTRSPLPLFWLAEPRSVAPSLAPSSDLTVGTSSPPIKPANQDSPFRVRHSFHRLIKKLTRPQDFLSAGICVYLLGTSLRDSLPVWAWRSYLVRS